SAIRRPSAPLAHSATISRTRSNSSFSRACASIMRDCTGETRRLHADTTLRNTNDDQNKSYDAPGNRYSAVAGGDLAFSSGLLHNTGLFGTAGAHRPITKGAHPGFSGFDW